VIALIPLAFPLVVDTCVLQPPIFTTSGETAFSLQVFLKGPIVRACWCAIRSEPWVFPVPTNGSVVGTKIFLRECQGGFH
jgi:hypothetical protein